MADKITLKTRKTLPPGRTRGYRNGVRRDWFCAVDKAQANPGKWVYFSQEFGSENAASATASTLRKEFGPVFEVETRDRQVYLRAAA